MDLINLIFPKKCLECARPGKYLCENCVKKVPPSRWTNQKVYSVWRYKGVIRKAIIALKYKFATDIARELANLCVERLLTISHWPSAVLVPVPLHWHRQNFRGFNQAEEIGKIIAERMNWKFIPDLLIKRKSTAPQANLKGSARRKNLKGVFAVSPSISVSQYPNIILFDDVFTTGSTLKEVMEVLKRAGARKVLGITLTR